MKTLVLVVVLPCSLVAKLGKSSLGLGYAIAITDLVLAPFIPSNAARSGGFDLSNRIWYLSDV